MKMKHGMIIDDISSLKPGEENTPPIFINFLHASSRPDDLVNSNVEIDVDVKVEKNAKSTFNLQLQTPNLSYVTAEDSQDQYFDTYIAIRDKASGKTRLVEAVNMSLKPKVIPPKSRNPIFLQALNDGTEETADEKKEKSNLKKRSLIDKFGQKKQQSYLNRLDSEAVDAADTEERVKKAIGDVKETDIMSKQIESEEGDLIPPRDEYANSVSDIYRIEHVLTEDEILDLTMTCKELLNAHSSSEAIDKAVESKILQPIGGYFMKQLLRRKDIIDEVEKDDMCALVVYLDTLTFFLNMKPHTVSKGFQKFPTHVPLCLRRKIFNSFSAGQIQKIITPKLRDKGVCHAIILCLMIEGGKMDTKLLLESIKVDPVNLPKLVSITGAHLVKDDRTRQKSIVLKKQLAKFDPIAPKNRRGKRKNL